MRELTIIMEEKIYTLLKDYIASEYKNKDTFLAQYNDIKDLTLDSLGVDSVDFITIILDLEMLTGKSINLNELDITLFKSISNIEDYLISMEV